MPFSDKRENTNKRLGYIDTKITFLPFHLSRYILFTLLFYIFHL